MQELQSITQFMGGPAVVGKPRTEFELIEVIRAGLPVTVIDSIVESSDLSKSVICESLRIAKRTFARRKTDAQRLKATESELLYRLSHVLVAARGVLGDEAKAKQWALTPNTALHGQRPIDLLDTGIGFEDVLNVLGRIRFGVYS